jgi:hypothetical protein
MTDPTDGIDVPVRFISLNRTDQVGAADHFVSVRVVPDGRDGNLVFARTLRPDEPERDEPVLFSPARGESLALREDSRVRIVDVDRTSQPDESGYASVANTIWTWLHLSGKATPQQFRFALATARRLDGSHLALTALLAAIRELNGSEAKQRTNGFRAVAMSEILVVALHRAVEMTLRCPRQLHVPVAMPDTVRRKRAAITALRNGFEHLEESATGRRKGMPDPDAASIFDQRRFFVDGTLVLGTHTLSVPGDVPTLLLALRTYLVEAVGALCGEWTPPDGVLFGPTGPGA